MLNMTLMKISNTILLPLLISLMIMLFALTLSKKSYLDREKMSNYECGFNKKMFSRNIFSLHFFLIAIIFLIFDVEICLILPFLMNMFVMNLFTFMIMMNMFMIILLLGTYHEWYQGSLNWTK